MTAYALIKWLHVLAAITALGANLTYGVWLSLASRDQSSLAFALRGIRFLDNRIANPAYGLLLVTGLLTVYVGGLPLSTPWILVALVLYVITVLVGILGFSPALRRQITFAESHGPSSPEYQQAARQGLQFGILTIALVVAIVFLMVVKPALW
jgi:uncharacterized membrane protein